MNELSNQVAIITGGGHGIGREIALAFGRAGARIVIAARSVEPMKKTCADLEAAGVRAIYLEIDVSKEPECFRMIEETLTAFGRVDILVNNAGISGPTKRMPDITLAEWNETIDIDLTGTWLATRAVVPVMDRQGSGNIINISSGAGRRGYALRTPYAAAKWAMIGLTQSVALEWGGRGIRCNCICPGAIEGDRIERVFHARAEAFKQPYEEVRAAFVGQSALKRLATEEEVARTALYLASSMSDGITGQSINVDCGSIMN
ncbi:MAG TPA: SDR family NAD(P)-dependent oxidoreductase [Candidatus Binataceae bacterium]|nr:SDR family NAD(P)-dependent oxidoreductase [Candidatus Binataceae bacterium]